MFIYGLRYDFYFFYHCLIGPHRCFGILGISHSVIQVVRLKHECFRHDKVGL